MRSSRQLSSPSDVSLFSGLDREDVVAEGLDIREEPELVLHPLRDKSYCPNFHLRERVHRSRGVPLFDLSRLMGTSAGMIDKTYGHMLPDALDRAGRRPWIWCLTSVQA